MVKPLADEKPRTGKPDEDEDRMTKDLAEDAVWKKMQQNTFTRWANEHLRTVNKHIADITTDFSDGIRLIALVEVLSGKRLPNYNKRPKVRAQKIENVNIALQFLKNDEKIRIVNIDSIDVVDGKVKLICGVMWTLILHYSISMPMWEGEDESMYKEKGGPSPKQRLLAWIQNKVPDVPINNFTTDWNNGIALGALVDACAPGLCPDWDKWKPNESLKNVQNAMKTAEEFLGVAPLVTPEEMINPKVDELSMMTFLSQFPNAKLKDSAPTKPRHNPKRVRCYGPGIQKTGVTNGAKTNFTVETFSAGDGEVQVFLEDPKGKQTPVDVKFNDDDAKTYTCTYTPKMEGKHKVIVKYSGTEVPKSPFEVEVKGNPGDPAKVKCEGPGLKPKGPQVGKQTYFDVDTNGAGIGQVEVVITDPNGKTNSVPMRLRQDGDDEKKYRCEYVPQLQGPHQIAVNFAGKPVPQSPFKTNVAPPCDPRKVRAFGRGLQPTGVRVNDIADFRVTTEGAGPGTPKIKVIGPEGKEVKCTILKAKDGFTYNCDYKPLKEGKYIVEVSFGDQEIFQSPFEVQVGPLIDSKVVAYGPGLKGGIVGYPAKFTVDTNGETGTLGFSVEGPSYAKIECNDNGDGSAEVIYHPTAPGEYAVHITVDGEDIPKSPYCPIIVPKTDFKPELVTATGPGLNPKGVVIAQPTEFTVDTRKAGGKKIPLEISVMDNTDYREVETKITDNKDGTYKVKYTPDKLGKHTVQINYGGQAVAKSPYRVAVGGVADPSKIKLYGPGLEKGVKPGKTTHFIVDARSAGSGELIPQIKDEKGNDVPTAVTDHQNGQYTVEYTAPNPGKYKVNATFAGKQIPKLPVDVNVTPAADVSKVKIEGLEPNQYSSCINSFTVNAQGTEKSGDGKISCTIRSPTGKKIHNSVENNNDGTYKVKYILPEEGEYTFDCKYDDSQIPGMPQKVKAKAGFDPKKVKVFGPGIEKGYANQPNEFTVVTAGAGNGGLGIAIEGPSEPKVTCIDNRDGSCTVQYIPDDPGNYNIAVKFGDQQVPGSPFKVPVQGEVDASKVTASGPGVDPNNCRATDSLSFKVNAKKSAKAPLGVEISTDKGPIADKPIIKDNNDGTYDVTYKPPPEGSPCNVKVTYGGKDIKGSTFKMQVKKKSEPNKVKISGLKEKVPASIPAEFIVDTKDAGIGDLQVAIMNPKDKGIRYWKTDFKDGTYKITYIPEDIGEHKVVVKFDGQEVAPPFKVDVTQTGDASKCKIVDGELKDKCNANEEYTIKVDASQAGPGSLTCKVTRVTSSSESKETVTERIETTPTGGKRLIRETRRETKTQTERETQENIDCKVVRNPDGTYSVNYKVKQPGNYTIEMKFGGQPIPGGVLQFTVD
ncbi:filamin-A-like [Dermatophagoides pteronyssinus]|uniref:filamin-A-like n=1 Tax=Dermatophagoides pteronyssinus TaxID=6956 RepID=UPI003F66AE9D